MRRMDKMGAIFAFLSFALLSIALRSEWFIGIFMSLYVTRKRRCLFLHFRWLDFRDFVVFGLW